MITSERAQFNPKLLTIPEEGKFDHSLLLVLRQMIKNCNTNDTHVTVSHYEADCGGDMDMAITNLSITAVRDGYPKAVTLTVDFYRVLKQLAGDELIDLTPAKIAEMASGSLFLAFEEEPTTVTPCGGFQCKLDAYFQKQDLEETRETA